jgi:hypothetical protein
MHLLISRCTCHNINFPVAAAAATRTPHPTADENLLPIICCNVKKTQPLPSAAVPVIVLSLADDLRRAAAVEAPQSTDQGSANLSRISDSSTSKPPAAVPVVLALHGSPKNLPVADVSAYRSNASEEDFAVASSELFSAAGRRTLRCLSADANAPQPPATTSAVKASSTPFLHRSATAARAYQDQDTAAHANHATQSPAGHQPSADAFPQSPSISTAGHDPQPAAAAIRYQPVARAPQNPVIRLNLADTLSPEAATSCHHAASSSDLHRSGAFLSGSAVPLAEPVPHFHGLSVRASQPAEGSLSASGRVISHQFTSATVPPVLQPSVICLNLANELASTACLVHPAADSASSPFGLEDQPRGAAVPKPESAEAVAHHIAAPPLPRVIKLSLAGDMAMACTPQPLTAPSFSTAQLQAQAAPEPQHATAQSPLQATVAPLAESAPAVNSQQFAAPVSQPRVIQLNLVGELASENAEIHHTGPTDATAPQLQAAPNPLSQLAVAVTPQQLPTPAPQTSVIPVPLYRYFNLVEELASENADIHHPGATDATAPQLPAAANPLSQLAVTVTPQQLQTPVTQTAVMPVPVYFNLGEEMAAVADTPVAAPQLQLQNLATLQVQPASTVIPHQLASQGENVPVIVLNLSDELTSEEMKTRAKVAPLVLSNAAAIPPLSSSNSTSTAVQPVAAIEDQIRLECGNAQFMQLVAYQCSGSGVKYSFLLNKPFSHEPEVFFFSLDLDPLPLLEQILCKIKITLFMVQKEK